MSGHPTSVYIHKHKVTPHAFRCIIKQLNRKHTFEIDEWYHCFNRGIDKRIVFADEFDARRFLMTLYLANGSEPVGIWDMDKPTLEKCFAEDRGDPNVSIGAYCLMPNHFHLLLKEIVEGGITSFMRKVGTAYTMYFNLKDGRTGNLFTKPFKSRHVKDDRYFQKVLEYIHFNPAELYEPKWKSGIVRDLRSLQSKLIEYPFSSLCNYTYPSVKNPILSSDGLHVTDQLPVGRMLKDAREYYSEISDELT